MLTTIISVVLIGVMHKLLSWRFSLLNMPISTTLIIRNVLLFSAIAYSFNYVLALMLGTAEPQPHKLLLFILLSSALLLAVYYLLDRLRVYLSQSSS